MNCHYRIAIWIACFCVWEYICAAAHGTPCRIDELKSGCTGPYESCYQQSNNSTVGVCECQTGYARKDGVCARIATPTTPSPHGGDGPTTPGPGESSDVSGSTIAASILIPLVLIVAAVGLVYSARRYKWLHRLHQLRQRRYDEVRIGQEDDDDDPPIA